MIERFAGPRGEEGVPSPALRQLGGLVDQAPGAGIELQDAGASAFEGADADPVSVAVDVVQANGAGLGDAETVEAEETGERVALRGVPSLGGGVVEPCDGEWDARVGDRFCQLGGSSTLIRPGCAGKNKPGFGETRVICVQVVGSYVQGWR